MIFARTAPVKKDGSLNMLKVKEGDQIFSKAKGGPDFFYVGKRGDAE